MGFSPNARKRRGWRNLIGLATTVAMLSLAGGALAAGSRRRGRRRWWRRAARAPEGERRPMRRDVRGLRTATVGSKVELGGRHLGERAGSRSRGCATRVGARCAPPSPDRTVKAKVPDRAATGAPEVDDLDNSTPSPKKLEIVDESEIPNDAGFKLAAASAKPRQGLLRRQAQAEQSPTRSAATNDRRADRGRRSNDGAPVVAAGSRRAGSPSPRTGRAGTARRTTARRRADGDYKFRVGPSIGGAVETTDDAKFSYHGYEFPIRGATPVRRRGRRAAQRPHAPGPGRVRQMRVEAGRGARGPGPDQVLPVRGRLLPGDRRQE